MKAAWLERRTWRETYSAPKTWSMAGCPADMSLVASPSLRLAVGAEHGERGDVPVAGLRGVLLHLGQHVAYYAAAVVLSDEQQLRPVARGCV